MHNSTNVVPHFGYCFLWTIENYSYAFGNESLFINSPAFTIPELRNTKWKVYCNPRSLCDGSAVKCYLQRLPDESQRVMTIGFEVQMVASDRETPLVRATFAKACEIGKLVGFADMRQSTRHIAAASYSNPNKCLNRNKSDGNLVVRVLIWQYPNVFGSLRKCYARTCVGVEKNFFHLTMGDSSRSIEGLQRKITILSLNYLPIITLSIAVSNDYFDMNVNALDCKRKILASINMRVMNFNGSVFSNTDHSFFFNSDSLKSNMRNNSYPFNSALIINCTLVTSVGIVSNSLENLGEGDLVIESKPPRFVFNAKNVDASIKKEPRNLTRNLSNDFRQLLNEGTLSDKDFCVSEKNFAVHKSILCARSPVFKAMFTNNMKEKNSRQDNIYDLDEDTMRRLLLFMYTDTVPDLDTNSATKLYAVADRYYVELLKQICSWFLQENVSPKSACSVLVLANSHCDQELKEFVKRFILAHKDIVHSDAWKLLVKEQPQLAAEVLSLKWQ